MEVMILVDGNNMENSQAYQVGAFRCNCGRWDCKWPLMAILLWFILAYPAFPVLGMEDKHYFFPIENPDFQSLKNIYENRNIYRNPYSVLFYIHSTMARAGVPQEEGKEFLEKVERDIRTYDERGLNGDEHDWFLRRKAFYYYLKGEDHEALLELNKIKVSPPYHYREEHGTLGIKRGAVTDILQDAFRRRLWWRPVVYWLNSFDVLAPSEIIGGIFVLPVFALRISPTCWAYWLWLGITVLTPFVAVYFFCRWIMRFYRRRWQTPNCGLRKGGGA